MGLLRPATPGLLVTLTATILLAIVTFCVPWIKSVYFLKAGLAVEGITGNITFGTLGYCTQLASGTNCTSPHVGYQLDINALVGDDTKIQIPQVVVKWITYALVLHIVALILAAGSTLFGILAHIREFSGSCLSTCISGFGAAVTLAAFIFDLAFFFIAKSRINSVDGGYAEIGNAVWLTLAAWLLLLFSGCFYCIGRCCISRRPRDTLPKHRDGSQGGGFPGFNNSNNYEDQMRLDAVKAEADRKARAKRGEVGLPAFQEYDPTQPLTKHSDEEESSAYHPVTGYAQAAPGTRAVDEYYNPNVYPPQPAGPRREGSNHSTTYVDESAVVPLGGAAAAAGTNAYLAAGQAHARGTPSQYSGHEQYPSNASGYAHSQAPSSVAYGQAVTHDYPTRSNSSPYHDPYAQPAPVNPPGFGGAAAYNPSSDPYYAAPQRQASHDPYYQSPQMQPQDAGASYYASPPVQSPPMPVHSPPQRHYTLGGGGYGDNIVPDFHDETPPHAFAGAAGGSSQPQYEDSPPVYDDGMSQPPGVYGAKGGHH